MHWLVRGLSCKPNIYLSWSTSELRVRLAPLNWFKPSSRIFYWLFQGSTYFVDFFYVFVLSCVCYVFVHVCLYVLCGHLLGKGWPLGSRLWCITVSLTLSHWYPGSGVVLDCIDSWSLHPFLLWFPLNEPCYEKENMFLIVRCCFFFCTNETQNEGWTAWYFSLPTRVHV